MGRGAGRGPSGPRVPRLASFRWWVLLFPSPHPAGVLSSGAPGASTAGWDPAALFFHGAGRGGSSWRGFSSRGTAPMRGGSRRGLRALPRVGSRGQPQGSAAGRPPPAPGTGTPGGHTPPSAGPRCRGCVTHGGGAALAPLDPSPPLSTCCSRASRVTASSPSTESRKTPNPSVRLAPSSLRARQLSRSSPASRPKITINPPRAEGHLTCQSPILARIDILAAGSESPGPCWSWTARASHSPGTPVGKSSPYLSRDSLTWP